MRAFVLTGHGSLDQLVYHEDWPVPNPGPDEVRVRVKACGLNNTDINTRTAWYSRLVTGGITESGGRLGFDEADITAGSWGNRKMIFPRIQGADVAGYIEAVGTRVKSERIGERVLVDPWLPGEGGDMSPNDVRYLGSEVDGGFAEYTVVPSHNAIRVDCPLSDAELATFPCAYGTAENLIGHTNLQPGETVVIAGASGGVGSAAIQLCRLRGARVIAIASGEKSTRIQELGADMVIDRKSAHLEAEIRAAAEEVDVVLDVVGGPLFVPLINSLRRGGRYSSAGTIAGPRVEFDLRQLVYRDLHLSGATLVPVGTMRRIVSLIMRGSLRPVLARTFPLRELAKAQETFLKKQHIGNLVVEIPD